MSRETSTQETLDLDLLQLPRGRLSVNRFRSLSSVVARGGANVGAAAWPMVDQAVVSLGNFLINIFLARSLGLADYGVFALLLGGLLGLQLLSSSLIIYPLSVRRPTHGPDTGSQLIGFSLLLVVTLSLLLCMILMGILATLGQGGIALPAASYFLMWQVQETLRRGLLAELRHRSALPGDSISYLGQFGLVVVLSVNNALTLSSALYAMSATSALAALVQYRQLSVKLDGPLSGKDIAKDFLSIGAWALGNNVLFTLRGLIASWSLAFAYGAASAGLLQAAQNVIFVANPIVLGLWSIIPQSVAVARKNSDAAAWQAARGLGSVGAIPIGLYYALVLAAPEAILSLFYGPSSYSATIGSAVRILAMGALMTYMAEVVSAYLYGVDAPREAVILNAVSTGAHALCAVPLAIAFGLDGACVGSAVAAGIRLAGTPWILRKVINRARYVPE